MRGAPAVATKLVWDRVKVDLPEAIRLILQSPPIEFVNFVIPPIVRILDPEQRAGRGLHFMEAAPGKRKEVRTSTEVPIAKL